MIVLNLIQLTNQSISFKVVAYFGYLALKTRSSPRLGASQSGRSFRSKFIKIVENPIPIAIPHYVPSSPCKQT
jgi:hypothetical protein